MYRRYRNVGHCAVPGLEIFTNTTSRIYSKQVYFAIFSKQMNYRDAHACLAGRFVPQRFLKQGIRSDALFFPH